MNPRSKEIRPEVLARDGPGAASRDAFVFLSLAVAVHVATWFVPSGGVWFAFYPLVGLIQTIRCARRLVRYAEREPEEPAPPADVSRLALFEAGESPTRVRTTIAFAIFTFTYPLFLLGEGAPFWALLFLGVVVAAISDAIYWQVATPAAFLLAGFANDSVQPALDRLRKGANAPEDDPHSDPARAAVEAAPEAGFDERRPGALFASLAEGLAAAFTGWVYVSIPIWQDQMNRSLNVKGPPIPPRDASMDLYFFCMVSFAGFLFGALHRWNMETPRPPRSRVLLVAAPLMLFLLPLPHLAWMVASQVAERARNPSRPLAGWRGRMLLVGLIATWPCMIFLGVVALVLLFG